MSLQKTKLTFCEFFFETGLDVRGVILQAASIGALARFGQTNHECRKSVQHYIRSRILYSLVPFMDPKHVTSFIDTLATTNSAMIGSLVLKILLNGGGSGWEPRDLNLATPRDGLQAFASFLYHIGYRLNNTGVSNSEAVGVLTHSEFIGPNQQIITVTEGKDRDSFISVVLGSNHTAAMNFISAGHCGALYPTQTLKQHITYAYRYPPGHGHLAKLQSRNFTVVTKSIEHPIESVVCCPEVQRQFVSYSGIGLFEWNVDSPKDNLLSRSYTWRLGDVCLREGCSAKKTSRLLVRRNSRMMER